MSQAASGMSPGTFTTPSRPLRWLITGCSSGLGLALARHVLTRGHQLVATSRCPESTPALVAEVERAGGRWARLDVTDPDCGAVLQTLEDEEGLEVDVLVSCAAASVHSVAEAFTEEEVRAQTELLYFGPFRLVRAAVPRMRARRFGVVVHVLAKEVAAFNVRTLTVHLGSLNTNMPEAAKAGSRRLPGDYEGSVAEGTVGVMRDGRMVPRGDKDKAARRIFEVAMGEGAGKGHEGEFFLPLGEEMPARIRLVRDRLDHCLEVYGDVCTSIGLDAGDE
ncbi:NAD(P)-binding domain protein [Cordyceps fumosorosea ARSEF 2679]|uniref:NAD(P)-binding domain protein n=1 Tax=Cordyceps fumosorosea (strain ARSEF 2679) TaxID=1081104 RepID=A0A162LPQ5_CORFA|nr:NAD(P)-binding domain protein [Cordyceps fumosorosea ARSEF 2679]OAA73844.1 NAD(P)-binding domain protein [Cordyceps fumosorosea ARSEF 2679]